MANIMKLLPKAYQVKSFLIPLLRFELGFAQINRERVTVSSKAVVLKLKWAPQ